jgi:hypothetical protein
MTEEVVEFDSDPYSLFTFALNSPLTKAKYIARLNKFLDFIGLSGSLQEKCRIFARTCENQQSWALICVIKFLQINKERV